MKYEANKAYTKKGNTVAEVKGDIGAVFSQLARLNCELWHRVEKSYDIDHVPAEEKEVLIKDWQFSTWNGTAGWRQLTLARVAIC